MVVLHICGEISLICISKKLELFIFNLSEKENINWKEDLEQDLQYMEVVGELDRVRFEISMRSQIIELYEKIYPSSEKPISFSVMVHAIEDKMIYMYFCYEYDDMPLGG